MKKDSIITILVIYFALIMCIGTYHFMIAMINIGGFELPKLIWKCIYNIAYNLIILSSLFCFWRMLKKESSKYKKLPVWFSIYFIVKIILNILFMFDNFRNFVELFVNWWGCSFSVLLLIISIGISLNIKNDQIKEKNI
jgi:hypothetical protein